MYEIQVGDEVTVDWPRKFERATYSGGTVQQITDKLIIIRHPTGYTFAVSKVDLMSGTVLTVTNRKEDTPEMPAIKLSKAEAAKILPPEALAQDGEMTLEHKECDCGGTCGDECKCSEKEGPDETPEPEQAEPEPEAVMTLAEAVRLTQELRAEAACCRSLLHNAGLTGGVTIRLKQYWNECSVKLERLEGAKVLLRKEDVESEIR